MRVPYDVTLPAVIRDVGLGPVGTIGDLELSYLLAFYGDEDTHEAERMLGGVVAALSAQPVVSGDALAVALAELHAADVADEVPEAELAAAWVRVLALDHDLETLAHVWRLAGDAPPTLSLLYRASWVAGGGA